MRSRIFSAAMLAFCLTGLPNASANVLVDGDLGDWGISFTNDHADFGSMTPGHGSATVNGNSFRYHIEDQDDSLGQAGFLGPNYGGQDYDSEFLGASITDSKVFIAILTGQRPDNDFKYFLPGDVRIKTAANTWFGVETGGGAGGNSNHSGQITAGDPGTTYNVNTEGHTTDVTTLTSPTSQQVAGAVFGPGTTWLPASTPAAFGLTDPQLTGGTYLGLADYIYRWNADSQHAMIEMAIDRSLFGGADLTAIEFSPGCGNDIVRVNFDPVNVPHAPEPASLILMVLGAVGIVFGRFRTQFVRRLRGDGV